jgi:metal-sulfur cluster biosynthetic enzyme
MENPNPRIREEPVVEEEVDEGMVNSRLVYQLIRRINDPEHPLTLEQLRVVHEDDCSVDLDDRRMLVWYTPTIPHCSMATLIGLSIRARLGERFLPAYHVDVRVKPGTHVSELSINKQLADKERVAAALENEQLAAVVQECLVGPPRLGIAL